MRKQITLLCLFTFIQFTISQSQQPQFRGGFCLKSETVLNDSTYNNNIFSLLLNLTSLSFDFMFLTFSLGSGLDRVNGLYLCRPDLSLESCHTCVSESATKFFSTCANKKEAILWYDECMIRYSNRSIFSTEEVEPASILFSKFNVSRPDLFPALLNRTVQKLILEAAGPDNTLRFATSAEDNFTAFEGLYGMVLCTQDITREDCQHCLTTAFGLISVTGLAQWNIIFLPSCQLRYDTAPFIFPSSPTAVINTSAPSPMGSV